MECGAGLGLVLILRWFWGRINAYVEITATLAPFVGYTLARGEWLSEDLGTFPNSFFFTVGFTTVAWLTVLFLTKPSAAWPFALQLSSMPVNCQSLGAEDISAFSTLNQPLVPCPVSFAVTGSKY